MSAYRCTCTFAARHPACVLVTPVVGFLSSGSRELDASRLTAFRQGLNEAGYVEGRNVAIEGSWAENHTERLPALATDLACRPVTVIAAAGINAALGAKIATTTIPIVFVTGVDPVATGLVASLSRPGGNLTGVTDLAAELGQKHLELLREVVTTARIVALLVNPANPNAKILLRELQAAGHKLGLVLHVLHASSERDFAEAFAVLSKLRAGALVIGNAVKVMCIATLPKPRCSRHCAAGRPATASWAVSASSVGLD